MAKIPTVQRRVTPSARGSFSTQQADTRVGQALVKVGGEIDKLGQTIGDMERKAKEIERTRKKNQAQLELQSIMNEFTVAHAEERNLDDVDQYKTSLEQRMNGVVAAQDDGVVREEIGFISERMKNSTMLSMDILDIRRNSKRVEDLISASREKALFSASNINNKNILMQDSANYIEMYTDNARKNGGS